MVKESEFWNAANLEDAFGEDRPPSTALVWSIKLTDVGEYGHLAVLIRVELTLALWLLPGATKSLTLRLCSGEWRGRDRESAERLFRACLEIVVLTKMCFQRRDLDVSILTTSHDEWRAIVSWRVRRRTLLVIVG